MPLIPVSTRLAVTPVLAALIAATTPAGVGVVTVTAVVVVLVLPTTIEILNELAFNVDVVAAYSSEIIR